MHLIHDSACKKSWHLTLAIPALIAGTLWFLAGGISIEIAGLKLVIATKSGSDYLLYITPWLTAIGARDWIEKVAKNGNVHS